VLVGGLDRLDRLSGGLKRLDRLVAGLNRFVDGLDRRARHS
jgi:hypothetical protein